MKPEERFHHPLQEEVQRVPAAEVLKLMPDDETQRVVRIVLEKLGEHQIGLVPLTAKGAGDLGADENSRPRPGVDIAEIFSEGGLKFVRCPGGGTTGLEETGGLCPLPDKYRRREGRTDRPTPERNAACCGFERRQLLNRFDRDSLPGADEADVRKQECGGGQGQEENVAKVPKPAMERRRLHKPAGPRRQQDDDCRLERERDEQLEKLGRTHCCSSSRAMARLISESSSAEIGSSSMRLRTSDLTEPRARCCLRSSATERQISSRLTQGS